MSCLHQKYLFPVLSTGVTPSFGAAGAAQKEVKPLGVAALLTLDVVEKLREWRESGCKMI